MKKTHKGIAKRFKVTGTGKVKFRKPGQRHLAASVRPSKFGAGTAGPSSGRWNGSSRNQGNLTDQFPPDQQENPSCQEHATHQQPVNAARKSSRKQRDISGTSRDSSVMPRMRSIGPRPTPIPTAASVQIGIPSALDRPDQCSLPCRGNPLRPIHAWTDQGWHRVEPQGHLRACHSRT